MILTPNRPPNHLFAALGVSLLLTACGGGGSGGNPDPSATSFIVTASAGTGGSFDSTSATVDSGNSIFFTVTADTGYGIDSVTGCDGSLSGNTYTTGAITADCTITASFAINQYTVSASAGAGGSFNSPSATVDHGNSTSFTVIPDTGYSISSVSGCGGSLSGNTYTTGAITAACSVSASFVINQYTVSASAGSNGSIAPTSATVDHGSTTGFTLTPDSGYRIDAVSGCSGSLSGTTYTTGAITANCTVSASFTNAPASAPSPSLSVTTKQLQFSWPEVANTHHYRILVNPDGASGFSVVSGAESIVTLGHNLDVSVHQLDWLAAEYLVEACNADNSTCVSSANQTLTAADSVAAIGYFKASNTEAGDYFGNAVSVSADGNTLAVSAYYEDSAATGVDGDQTDNTVSGAGAVYVFVRGESWSQQAYLKASNPGANNHFGEALSLSADGNTLAVGSNFEDSAAIGINGDQTDTTATSAGAVYVYSRSAGIWSQQAYVKASNTQAADNFGYAVSLSSDGNILAVGAIREGSAATGIDGVQTDNTAANAGAVYVFSRSGTTWSQQAYVKASNTQTYDFFGYSVSLSGDGATLAVGANLEDSAATGIDGDQTDNSADTAGAVYIFSRTGTVWSQQAYLKGSNTEAIDYFGGSLSLSYDGNTLAIGAHQEDSAATGINGDQKNNTVSAAGAVYVFDRTDSTWSQQAYIKASNTETGDYFGYVVSLSADGNTLAVGAHVEDSAATGIDGDQIDNSAGNSGAAYVFSRNGTTWSQQAYVKAPNTRRQDLFGKAVSLSNDGTTLAVGAYQEDSIATGVGGDQTDDTAAGAGAVYLY